MKGRRAVALAFCLAVGWVAHRAARRPGPSPTQSCADAIAVQGRIACGDAAAVLAATHGGLRPGDHLRGDGVIDRMPPEHLAALGIPIDVNGAPPAELASLRGIGPALARRIVAARPFASVDALQSVSGIGPRTLQAIRPRVVLSGPTRTGAGEGTPGAAAGPGRR